MSLACLLNLQSATGRPSGLVCVVATHPINDYYVVTSRRGERTDRWSWEILRKSTPLGIKMTGDGYQSDTAARFAGTQALADFLSDLLQAEKRKQDHSDWAAPALAPSQPTHPPPSPALTSSP